MAKDNPDPAISELIKEIDRWAKKTVLEIDTKRLQDADLISKALKLFITDYQRYFPEEKFVDIKKLQDYPTLQNTLLYRIAHLFYKRKEEDIALKLSTLGRVLSGIEIYYSSEIGKSFLVHHGLGTVIGARCKIGDNVTIYQGVTLGDRKGGRPTLKDNVIVYAGSQVLGEIVIGESA